MGELYEKFRQAYKTRLVSSLEKSSLTEQVNVDELFNKTIDAVEDNLSPREVKCFISVPPEEKLANEFPELSEKVGQIVNMQIAAIIQQKALNDFVNEVG